VAHKKENIDLEKVSRSITILYGNQVKKNKLTKEGENLKKGMKGMNDALCL